MRAGPPLEGAVRERLHAEVSRVYHGECSRGARLGWWRAVWFRWAVASAAVVGVGVLVVQQLGRKPVELAQMAEQAETSQAKEFAQDAPPTAPQLVPSAADTVRLTFQDKVSSAPPTVESAAATSLTEARANATDTALAMKREIPQAAQPLQVAAVAAEQAVALNGVARQQFRSEAQTNAVPPGRGVLRNFELEVSNGTIRLTEPDGSIYLGTLVEPGTPGLANGVATPTSPASARAAAAGSPGQRLRFTGTNRTLGRIVSFDGQYVTAGASTLATESKAATNQAKISITGTAIIGGAERVLIRAVSVER